MSVAVSLDVWHVDLEENRWDDRAGILAINEPPLAQRYREYACRRIQDAAVPRSASFSLLMSAGSLANSFSATVQCVWQAVAGR